MEAGYPLSLAERLAATEADLHPRRRARPPGLRSRDRGRESPLDTVRPRWAWHPDRVAKAEAIQYGDRKVYSVRSFNRGVADWLQRLPTVWVEGELTELRRHPVGSPSS